MNSRDNCHWRPPRFSNRTSETWKHISRVLFKCKELFFCRLKLSEKVLFLYFILFHLYKGQATSVHQFVVQCCIILERLCLLETEEDIFWNIIVSCVRTSMNIVNDDYRLSRHVSSVRWKMKLELLGGTYK